MGFEQLGYRVLTHRHIFGNGSNNWPTNSIETLGIMKASVKQPLIAGFAFQHWLTTTNHYSTITINQIPVHQAFLSTCTDHIRMPTTSCCCISCIHSNIIIIPDSQLCLSNYIYPLLDSIPFWWDKLCQAVLFRLRHCILIAIAILYRYACTSAT